MIFTDSLSVLQSYQSCKINIGCNSYILEIKNKYQEILNKNSESTITFSFITSPCGVFGNEQAKASAKNNENDC